MIKSFVEEALELCENAESALLALEKIPDDESAGQAFRAFHNIKGNAGFLGYGDLEKISHLAENLLDGSGMGRDLRSGHHVRPPEGDRRRPQQGERRVPGRRR